MRVSLTGLFEAGSITTRVSRHPVWPDDFWTLTGLFEAGSITFALVLLAPTPAGASITSYDV